MNNIPIQILIRQKYNWLISASFFGAAYLFLFFAVKTELIYYYFQMRGKSADFRTGAEFLLDCISYPGGPAQYLAALFTQLCYFPWLGPLFIILLAWGLYRFTVILLNISPENPLRIVCYVPAFLILMKCGRYENPLGLNTALLFVMLITVLYQKISASLGRLRFVLFLLSSLIIYCLAGGAGLIFVVLAVLFELFEKRKPVSSIAFLIAGAAVCWLSGAFLFRLDSGDSFLSLIPYIHFLQFKRQEIFSRFIDIILLGFLPAAVLLKYTGIAISSNRKGKTCPERSRRIKNRKSAQLQLVAVNIPGWAVRTVLLILIGVPAVVFPFNWQAKRILQMNYYANRKMWPEVLEIARKGALKKYFPYCTNAVNRALFYTGRLGEEMFSFPQKQSDYDLVFNRELLRNISNLERPQLCLDLGMLNAAETIAYNFLSPSNGNPGTIKQLAQINLVKGQIDTARIYLNALSRYPAYAKEAVYMLHNIEQDPLLERDQLIQSLREIMIENEFVFFGFDEELWLKDLLRKNKNNKMAFEYLMAYYLLNCRLDKFVENLPRLDDLGYKYIPRHYQEAVLVYKSITQKNIDLGGREINPEIVNQFNQISEIVNNPDNSNLETLKRKLSPLSPKLGATYFFYYLFGSNEKT
jgi:hypothetical protein